MSYRAGSGGRAALLVHAVAQIGTKFYRPGIPKKLIR
jgi:hypothetical protein